MRITALSWQFLSTSIITPSTSPFCMEAAQPCNPLPLSGAVQVPGAT
ncbi:MAG: hypothetical protein PHQ65_15620 [Bacteroidales bacterium]|nr:hypothetical protein [Bacteroidales bacterium]